MSNATKQEQIYKQFKKDRQFRLDCQRTAKHVGGTTQPAYEYNVDGEKLVIRHNKNGKFTWIL